MNTPHVLLSERMAPSLPALREDYPQLTFSTIPMEGPFLEEYLEAEILWMSAMSDELFDGILERAPDLKWVQLTAAGFDWILRDGLTRRMDDEGMHVTRSVNSFNVPIAEYVVGMMHVAARRVPEHIEAQARREWIRLEQAEIGGSTVVVVGTGAIGGEVAWRCRALGANVIGVSRSGDDAEHFDTVVPVESLDTVLPDCDYLVLATPLTPETQDMIDARRLRLMKSTATLINVGRGGCVVDDDLIAALEDGVIALAILDVFDQEPLPADSPLWEAKNILLTPHASFRGEGNLPRLLADFRINLDRFLADEPLIGTMKVRALGY